jgi:spore germination protein YaaH
MVQTLYPAVIEYAPDYKMVITDKTDTQKQMGQITAKNTNMRYEPDIKSPIQKKLTQHTPVTVYNEADDKFTKIRTEDGLIGYIYTKDFAKTQLIAPELPEREDYTPPFTEKIILAWDQIYSYDTNFAESRRAENKGVNVLSPTWFTFDAEKMDGSIINLADLSYVERAHERGVQVWALISDSFNAEIADMVLRNPDTREFVIKQLLTLIKIYDLDGINVDFEQITEDTAPYYLQFMRELAPFMRDAGAVLSVDMYVPTYTKHYNRTEVAKVADYICVMTYDEHYGEASGSGPVASLPFVEDGITETLLEVPKEKLILGLPFYTRVWRETDDGGVSVDANMPMGYAEARFKENGADEFEWIEEAGSYYGQYRADEDGVGVTYKTWFEDAVSIEEKLKLYEKYSLAGVCCWSRGLETDNVWDLIDGYVNN